MTRLRALLFVAVALAVGSLAACARQQAQGRPARLTVLAAASLADAFREIGMAFEAANPGVKVDFSFGGSNQLRTQLENGAPGDVFASADRKQMDSAVASKVVDDTGIRTFAHNRLVVIVPKENRAGIARLADLARPGLKIVIADKAVPAGNYTRLMLERAGASAEFGASFVTGFEANVASREENVAAVVAKIALNQADAGLAYASDAAGGNGPNLTLITLPAALEQRADYVAAVTARASDRGLASRFVDFLISQDATATLVGRGFLAPENPEAGAGGAR